MIYKEAQIMKLLTNCPHIVTCEDCFCDNKKLYLVMENYTKTLQDEINAVKQAQPRQFIQPARVRKWMK